METIEEFRIITGFEPYEISNLGRLKRGSKILTTPSLKNGYKRKFLKAINKNILIHRAIAIAFIPNPLNLKEVNHIDLNKSNNSIENLEWTSRSGNAIHAMENGLLKLPMMKADKCPNAKLNNQQVLTIRKLIDSGMRQSDIALKYDIDQSTVSMIKTRKNWKSLC